MTERQRLRNLQKDAARYQWLRSAASRGPRPFNCVRAMSVSVCDWGSKLAKVGQVNRGCWSSLELFDKDLDREIDRQRRAAR